MGLAKVEPGEKDRRREEHAVDAIQHSTMARQDATAVFGVHRSLEQRLGEVADLGERFATRKRVDRAKGLLMAQLKLSEPEAFRWIQKTAMDLRKSMREVAQGVIDHAESEK